MGNRTETWRKQTNSTSILLLSHKKTNFCARYMAPYYYEFVIKPTAIHIEYKTRIFSQLSFEQNAP